MKHAVAVQFWRQCCGCAGPESGPTANNAHQLPQQLDAKLPCYSVWDPAGTAPDVPSRLTICGWPERNMCVYCAQCGRIQCGAQSEARSCLNPRHPLPQRESSHESSDFSRCEVRSGLPAWRTGCAGVSALQRCPSGPGPRCASLMPDTHTQRPLITRPDCPTVLGPAWRPQFLSMCLIARLLGTAPELSCPHNRLDTLNFFRCDIIDVFWQCSCTEICCGPRSYASTNRAHAVKT